MTGRTVLLFLALGAAAIWLLSAIGPELLLLPSASEWRIEAGAPLLVGTADDPFAYAGGDGVRAIDGQAVLQLGADRRGGSLRIDLRIPETDESVNLPLGMEPGSRIVILATLEGDDNLWSGVPIGGTTGIGEQRLPQTQVMLAGRSAFDVTVDDASTTTSVPGFWAVADALRREDGSVGQQGLIFSPLLREKTGFSDPSRTELTLLLYDRADDEPPSLLLHVVFSEIQVESTASDP